MTLWIKAPLEVIALAEELIEEHYDHLAGADIGFVFREDTPVSNGRATLGQASAVSSKLTPYLNLQFMIWLPQDAWIDAQPLQKRAMLDSLLYSCRFDNETGKPRVIKPDVQEHSEIIKRYGLWNRDLWKAKDAFESAVQYHLPFFDDRSGALVSLDPAMLAQIEE